MRTIDATSTKKFKFIIIFLNDNELNLNAGRFINFKKTKWGNSVTVKTRQGLLSNIFFDNAYFCEKAIILINAHNFVWNLSVEYDIQSKIFNIIFDFEDVSHAVMFKLLMDGLEIGNTNDMPI